jgi:hypothetical protein
MLAAYLRRPMIKIVPRDSLVLEYFLEQSVLGTVVKNTATAGVDGIKAGTPAAFPGIIGNSWNFNSNGGINSNIKTPANAISYAFDLNIRSSFDGYIFGDFSSTGSNESTRFSLRIQTSSWTVFVANGSTYWATSAAHGLTVDVWNKIVVTFVGTTIKIYVNNALQHTLTSGIARATAASPNYLAFGRYSTGAGTFPPIALDNVRLYNRELTFTDIAILYAESARKDSRWNSADKGANVTLSQNDRIASCTFSHSVRGRVSANSGKRMFEFTQLFGNSAMLGVGQADADLLGFPGKDANAWGYYASNGQKYNNDSASSYGSSWTATGNVIGVVVDFIAGTLTYYLNGVSQGIAFTDMNGRTLFPMVGSGAGSAPAQGGILNVGESGFAFPVAGAIGWAT